MTFELTAGLAYSHDGQKPGMMYRRDRTDSDRFLAAWHVANCQVEECEQCSFLAHEGQVISCDKCGHVHHTDWLGWTGSVDGDGTVTVLCPECEKKE
jgi:hypothetical protein